MYLFMQKLGNFEVKSCNHEKIFLLIFLHYLPVCASIPPCVLLYNYGKLGFTTNIQLRGFIIKLNI